MNTSSSYTVDAYRDGTPCNIGDIVKSALTGRTLWRVVNTAPRSSVKNDRTVACELVGLESQPAIDLDVVTLRLIERAS